MGLCVCMSVQQLPHIILSYEFCFYYFLVNVRAGVGVFLHFSAKLGTQINRKCCRTRHEEKNETKWMMIENCRQETKLARKSHCAIEFEDASDIPTSIFKAEIINFH